MVPLALPEGEHGRNFPKVVIGGRQGNPVGVSRNPVIPSAIGPRLGSSKNSP
jgi:hypothetical protein